ncbi:tyrosine-type recombinase/integrase [Chitinilyticum litopenaei]|uniref:tyrosine-type recombinase/integrase n=1 Tax=Chitinilyticum litopenaei TaxID=1121276 RepID=UPI00048F1A22|nr:site-specific integrase [Chitinilyticum litopenaei]
MAKAENQISVMQLKKLKPGNKGDKLADGGGLTGRVFAGDPLSVGFTYQFRSPETGKLREISCGAWPADDLSAIRKLRDEYRHQVRDGIDPLAQRQREREAAEAARLAAEAEARERAAEAARKAARLTYADLVSRYEAAHTGKLKRLGEMMRRHRKDALPAFGDVLADEVTPEMIIGAMQKVNERGAGFQSYILAADAGRIYNWARALRLVPTGCNPAAEVEKAKIGTRDRMRERVLSEAELRMLLADQTMPLRWRLALRLILATACRISEACEARWAEFDLAAGVWTLPEARSKNSKAHLIHLSAFALDTLKLLREVSPGDWLFPDKSEQQPIRHGYLSRRIHLARQNGTLALSGDWTAHDLRRTAGTMMGDLGVLPSVIDKCLNHQERNRVTATYQRQQYLPERKAAFDLLGARLELLANPEAGNVVSLRRA